MSYALNLLIQKVPSEKLEGDHSMVGQMKEVNSVDNLFGRDDNIDDFKVILQSVADKGDAGVNKIPQFLVRGLQG